MIGDTTICEDEGHQWEPIDNDDGSISKICIECDADYED